MMKPNSYAGTLRVLGALSVALILTIGLFTFVLVKQLRDENATALSAKQSCHIQAVSLRATKYLVAALDDTYHLLTLPPSPSELKSAASTPMALRQREAAVVAQLTSDVAAYVAIQHQNPPSRACP
jgi:hypothetical protein